MCVGIPRNSYDRVVVLAYLGRHPSVHVRPWSLVGLPSSYVGTSLVLLLLVRSTTTNSYYQQQPASQ